MIDHKGNRKRAAKKLDPPKNQTGFRPGKSGVCEAVLWEFFGPSQFLEKGDEIPVERVAAASLEQALQFLRREYPDFVIARVISLGIIAMLSGSPLD